MDSPLIQLLLKGRLVETFSFKGDTLRIGRMRENDIVISNASVSRFHAELKREKGKVILEDSGSEKGCYVNGTRIVNSIVLAPGDEILIGKHQLVLTEAEAEEEAPSELVKEEKNDAWDASKTYFVAVEDQAKMLEGAAAEPDAEDEPSLAAASGADEAESSAQEIEPVVDDALIESATAAVEGAEPEPIADAHPEPFERFTSLGCPSGHLGDPERVADAIVFLCSPRGGWINGALIPVDGGQQWSSISPVDVAMLRSAGA